jgi:poly-gamma-glutamate synthesis protein (capsule biosynthesis protein)
MKNEMYLELIKPLIGSPDWLHLSNEVSMQANCDYSAMKMKFATRPEHFEIFNLLGADIIELTGNHNLDVGQDAYVKTYNWLASQGMKTFGGGLSAREASAPLVLELKDGKRVAWIGFNEFCPCGECADVSMGANRYKEEQARQITDELRKQVDYIIACVQFGESDSYIPTASQRKISKTLIDAGADVVIGSQAHQPQTFEYYNGKLIFYGIGNFMFDQIHRVGVRQAYFLECYFYKGSIVQFIPRFTYMGEDRRPAPASNAQIAEIKRSVYLPNFFLGK